MTSPACEHYITPFFLFFLPFILFSVIAFPQGQQGSSSIIIHDSTTATNGGERATEGLRNEIGSALQREKPCVETMDDQDIRDSIQDERERALLEGGDSDAALKALGDRMGSSMVMSVQAMPGPGGSTVYSVFVMDTRTGRTVARGMGYDPAKVAGELVRQLGPYLRDTCKPHWTGTIDYEFISNESKSKTDGGPAHATWRNVTRTITETSIMQSSIKAALQAPADGTGVNSPKARVSQRVKFTHEKSESTSGETRCREPGRNPYFTKFSQEYKETTTQLGQGTDLMPVYISVDSDGSYSIKVVAPGGRMIGKIETNRSYSGCPSDTQQPTNSAVSTGEGEIESASFDAEGKVDPNNKDVLSGSQTLPDGKTKITWNLRLIKPTGM